MYIFGDVFLRNYYSFYDFDSNKVGLVENVDNIGYVFVPKEFPTWAIVLIVVASLLVVGAIIFFIVRHRR